VSLAFDPTETELLYGAEVNLALLELVGPVAGTVLDVGCGQGALGERLRATGADRIVGVELSATAAEVARRTYDSVVVGRLEELTLENVGGAPFDLIVTADVLEHLYDPWAALSQLRSWAAPNCRLVVSVPNLRFYRISLGLVLRGEFTYARGGGLMDRGHIRWFTPKSLTAALTAAGWEPVARSGGSGRKRRILGRLALGTLDDLLEHQLHVVARAA
jgi:2-polyprenyl-3-methyl-5-hydroxy-6-metoxy-1,4-benzoquinol methylase